jgi:hypothetical protein
LQHRHPRASRLAPRARPTPPHAPPPPAALAQLLHRLHQGMERLHVEAIALLRFFKLSKLPLRAVPAQAPRQRQPRHARAICCTRAPKRRCAHPRPCRLPMCVWPKQALAVYTLLITEAGACSLLLCPLCHCALCLLKPRAAARAPQAGGGGGRGKTAGSPLPPLPLAALVACCTAVAPG